MPEQNRILCRELSLLAFNRRVLALAQDTKVPLLERLRFLCIVSSNLDEFFEVRMAWLKRENKLRPHQPLDNGKTAAETIEAVAKEAQALIREQYDLFNKVLQPALSRAGIHFYRRHKWTTRGKMRGACTIAIPDGRPNASVPSSSPAKLSDLFNGRGNGCDGSRPIGVRMGNSSLSK